METLEELEKAKKEIDEKIAKVKEEEIRKRREKVAEKISSLTDDEKDFLLSLVEHDRTSCSDSNPCNGRYSSSIGKWRCRKCMLIEVLHGEHGTDFDFTIEPDFLDVENF